MALNVAPLAGRRALLGAAVESTTGTVPSITTALGNTVVYDAKMFPEGIFDDGPRQPIGNYLGTYPRVKGLQRGRCTFRIELRHGDAFFTLLKGCGYGVSDNVAAPVSNLTQRDTIALVLWEGGRVKKLAGANGTFKLSGTAGQRVFAEFDFQGIWQAVTDGAMPSDPTLTTPAFVLANTTLELGEASLPYWSQFEIDGGVEVVARLSGESASGLAHYLAIDRNPKLTIDPEARLVQTHDAYGALLAGTPAALEIVLTDGSNTLTIESAAAQRVNVSDEERDRIKVDSLEMELHNSTGDDDLKFTLSSSD